MFMEVDIFVCVYQWRARKFSKGGAKPWMYYPTTEIRQKSHKKFSVCRGPQTVIKLKFNLKLLYRLFEAWDLLAAHIWSSVIFTYTYNEWKKQKSIKQTFHGTLVKTSIRKGKSFEIIWVRLLTYYPSGGNAGLQTKWATFEPIRRLEFSKLKNIQETA